MVYVHDDTRLLLSAPFHYGSVPPMALSGLGHWVMSQTVKTMCLELFKLRHLKYEISVVQPRVLRAIL